MADIDRVILMLEKVRRTGENKWLACYPAHNDKSPSLAIKSIDGKILIHCFAGCDVTAIVESIGLTLTDLMPDKPHYQKTFKPPKFNKYELFDRVFFESIILYTAVKRMMDKKPLSNNDQQRVEQAMEIIFDIKREVSR